ncbi:3-isopropylmalate dehydratase large subunit [Caballeronia sp. LZ001]|jgi:3-isopropylmalate/(R)-2-methylmalate dehydratase large subunit|uniref:3-isopropylmalate dehydratase large subunit n=1 Tax=Caballeronia sp. LZ001 TaxID=3038553 RepID=UPI00285EC91D|nr:3-isopropylmalate dehydratase large subunit [Caballeronia sp. LZ001]MDR5805894.1 3-isopropylmalate dehydratase large subunit [Caballeronia sp. LZ001]
MHTLFDKLWDSHTISHLAGGADLLHVDRHLMHELTGVEAVRVLEKRGLGVDSPALTFATVDHVISTAPGRRAGDADWSTEMVESMRTQMTHHAIPIFDIGQAGLQGIVHVIGPELGLSLPGTSIVCADSHTCTHGAMGALAFGIGSTEVVHVLATQTIRQKRPKTMRVRFNGKLREGVTAKDMILYLIGKIGAAGGTGYAVEYAGDAVEALSMEGRLTLCNLSIELGSKFGLVAPDETTFAYLRDKPYAPQGEQFDQAVADWKMLASDSEAQFDREIGIDASSIGVQVTWGTSPEHVIALDDVIPDPASLDDESRRHAAENAIDYMGVRAGQHLDELSVDRVFIGSCTNSRIEDLRAAAHVVHGQHVASNVKAWVVPGSLTVARQAEQEGLDAIFRAAGFEWREPGCSMCVGANGDVVGRGERCVSTSNRNFIGRQGPGARTHLASPAVAAASAIAGHIAAPRVRQTEGASQ